MAKIANIQTVDITKQFGIATKAIEPGTLVKDEFFSLFEAVGALEIGDPKMDSGCLLPGETLEHDFDMMADLALEEVLWLMDEMLNREVAWYMGYPLSQTLFTSVHIDRLLWPIPTSLDDSTFARGHSPDLMPLPHRLLRVYCLLLIKSGDHVLSMVRSQHFHEEEDFTTQLFNRELLQKFSADQVLAIAPPILLELSSATIDTQLRDALVNRLQFRVDTLEMLRQHVIGANTSAAMFAYLETNLDKQQATSSCGKMVPEAFSTKLQRLLASTVPPRPMVTVSMDSAWSFWRQMLRDCKQVFAVFTADHSQDLLTVYQTFAFQRPELSTYSKSLLQSFLDMNSLVANRISSIELLQEDLKSFSMPATSLLPGSKYFSKPIYRRNSRMTESIALFLEKTEQSYVNIYRALCLNGCRIRRTFCHALQEWDVLQLDSEEIDTTIHDNLSESALQYDPSMPPTHAFRLSSWVYHHKLSLLEQVIQMGFEQMIYAPHELAGMYWYLSYVCDVHLSHLERVSHFTSAHQSKIERSMASTDLPQAREECKFALQRQFQQYSWIKSTQLLARATYLVYVILYRLGIFSPKGSLYSSMQLRYEIRMKPFAGLSIPEPLPLDVFEDNGLARDLSIEDLLANVTKVAEAAKKAWEEVAKAQWNLRSERNSAKGSVVENLWSRDVKDCVKTAIAIKLCVATLKKYLKDQAWIQRARSDAKIPDIEDKARWHRWWIVPTLPAT